jgi:hypothetical protein
VTCDFSLCAWWRWGAYRIWRRFWLVGGWTSGAGIFGERFIGRVLRWVVWIWRRGVRGVARILIFFHFFTPRTTLTRESGVYSRTRVQIWDRNGTELILTGRKRFAGCTLRWWSMVEHLNPQPRLRRKSGPGNSPCGRLFGCGRLRHSRDCLRALRRCGTLFAAGATGLARSSRRWRKRCRCCVHAAVSAGM